MTVPGPDGVQPVENTLNDNFVIGTVIQGQTVHVTLPAKVTPALGGLPRPAAVFTGRDGDVESLLKTLDPEGPGGALLVSAVAGMAGVGKTELVLQVAHEALRSDWFPGGALFVDLAGYDQDRRLSAADALLGWLSALGVPGEHIPASEQDRARLWRTIVDAYVVRERRLLLVVDNAAAISYSTVSYAPVSPKERGPTVAA